jgi:4-aminobutyrate aminotransferase
MTTSHRDIAQSESDTNDTDRRSAWQARSLDTRTRALLAADEAYFLRQSVSTPCLNAIARAEGIWIEDIAGRRYMDFHGNNVHHIGYGHPRLKRAIAEQMDRLPFAPRRYACDVAAELAAKLAAIAPGNLSKLLFTTGGSDAVEVAVKIARTATGRHKTISFWDAFHGAGFGAAALSGEALFRAGPAAPLVAGAEHVAPFACYRCPYGYPTDASGRPQLDLCNTQCARMVEYVLSRESDVAAVIAEPARAVPYLPPPGFWRLVREACDRHGALLIFDEIPTGLGKTGRMFACEHDGVVPDILVMGKALGGGILPIATVIARPELDVGGKWAFGHYTHEKNPVTARDPDHRGRGAGRERGPGRRGGADAARGDAASPSLDRRRAWPRSPARNRTCPGPGGEDARWRPRGGHALRLSRPRRVAEDHDGERRHADAAADHIGGRDG